MSFPIKLASILATFSLSLGCATQSSQRPLSNNDGATKVVRSDATSSKLVRSSDGIPGRYIVVLASGPGAHVQAEASALSAKYGGTLAGVMDQLGMFVIEIDDSKASALADDASVTNVSQDRTVSIQAE